MEQVIVTSMNYEESLYVTLILGRLIQPWTFEILLRKTDTGIRTKLGVTGL